MESKAARVASVQVLDRGSLSKRVDGVGVWQCCSIGGGTGLWTARHCVGTGGPRVICDARSAEQQQRHWAAGRGVTSVLHVTRTWVKADLTQRPEPLETAYFR